MIERIILKNVLPAVFAGAENEPPVCDSQVWLRDVTFERGRHYLVEAESGTGKSSLCSFLYGNRSDYSGSIMFNDSDISRYGIDEWCDVRRHALAILPQEMRLFPELTAMENIMIKNRLTHHHSDEHIMGMLTALELGHKADVPAGHLSVGQQQRVAIVRALCQPFDFILLDEPVSHLDARNNVAVAELILTESVAQGAGIIATSVGNNISITPDKVLML